MLQCGYRRIRALVYTFSRCLMKKKAVAVICLAAVAVSAVLALVFIPRDITLVTSTSSFIFSSNSVYDTNPVLKITVPSIRLGKEGIQSAKAEIDKRNEEALKTVVQQDGYAFHSEFTSAGSCACEVGSYIYYFRVNDTGNIYKLNKDTGDITSCPLSGYNDFSSAERQAAYDEVDHNFTCFVCIKTEALTDTYPELRNAIDGKDGHFYCNDIYYEGGRIFFLKNDVLYEFIPETGKAKKVTRLKTNLEFIAVS